MRILLLLLFCNGVMISCSNNNPTVPPVTPPVIPVTYPDTLTTGWTVVDTIPGNPAILDIYFANNLLGYLCDETGIRKSTDGGNTWTKVFDSKDNYNLACTADGKVFVVGLHSKLYFSLDNCASFDSLNLGGSSQSELKDVYFTDNNNGFTARYNKLFHTINGGITWDTIQPIGIPFFALNYSTLFFINSTGWVASAHACYHTNGAINDWQPSVTTFPSGSNPVFTGLYATDINNVFLIKKNGEIFKSVDGGANYSNLAGFPHDPTSDWADIHFIDSNIGYASCGKKIYKTSDGGGTWQTVVSMGNTQLGEIHFTDVGHGWVCGVNGTVLVYRP